MSIALFTKTWRDHWKSYLAWTLTLVGISAIELSIYPSIAKSGEAAKQFIDSYPEAFKQMFRIEDYTSGSGFLGTELYSMMVPLILIAIGATWGASAIAEEEEKGTADILFSLPISRMHLLITKVIAAISSVTLLGFITALTIQFGAPMVDMEIDSVHLYEASLLSIVLGILFLGIGLLCGILTSKKSVAVGIGTGIALIFFLIYSLAPLVTAFDSISPLNPFQWAIGENPLANGASYLNLVKLAALALATITAALFSFTRKDIKS